MQIFKEVVFILVENQKIKIKWSKKTYKHYVEKGYQFTKWDDYFDVDVKDLAENSTENVCLICDYCKEEKIYRQYRRYVKTKDQKDCCHHCRVKKSHETDYEKRKNKAFDALEQFCKEKDYELLTSRDSYSGVYMEISYICKKHGLQTGSLDNMIHGHGCIDCQHEKVRDLLMYSSDYVEEFINSYNGNILLNKDEYCGANVRNLKIKCGLCGKPYTTSFSDYKHDEQRTCLACGKSMSIMERKICNFLDRMNIEYVPEKSFEDCRYIRKLLFDFYLPEYNLLIEYDGEGHYLEKFYKNRFDDTLAALKETQKRDQIKTKYCQDNNIPLLRIPYWEKENFETIIINKINALNKKIKEIA